MSAHELFTIAEVISITGGRLKTYSDNYRESEESIGRRSRRSEVQLDNFLPLTSVVIDSRCATPQSLFVPLPGTRTNGHEFIEDAFSNGSNATLCSEDEWQKKQRELSKQLEKWEAIAVVVPSPLEALQTLAGFYMDRSKNVCRVGITGSNGKTTTKEIIGSILKQSHNAFVNEGNINSEIGVPLSAFLVDNSFSHSVFEMAMNRPGEMEIISRIVKPDVALITNIGVAHIGYLGSKKAIAAEKKKILSCFNGDQTAFIYEDEPFFEFLQEGVNGTILKFGPKSTPGYEGSDNLGLDGTLIHWEGTQIRFPYPGIHNLLNALGAISIALHLGITKEDIKNGIENLTPIFGRSQVIHGRITIILDCYNSSTESVLRIFNFISSLNWPGNKIAVLGSMLELGTASVEEHIKVLQNSALAQFDSVFLLGDEFRTPHDEMRRLKSDNKLMFAESSEACADMLNDILREGDLILLKASRGIEMEKLLPSIEFVQQMFSQQTDSQQTLSQEMMAAGRDYGS